MSDPASQRHAEGDRADHSRAPAPAAARWAAAWSARRRTTSGRRPSGWSGGWRPSGPRRSPSSLLAVVSVALMSIGPRILGHATDLIFAGLLGKQLPAGVTQEQAVEALRARGDVRQADLIANMDDLVPGAGRRLRRRRATC